MSNATTNHTLNTSENVGDVGDVKLFYSLGQRDMLAGILAENYKEKKMPELAKEYQKYFGDHFSLQWHLEV